MTEARNRQLKRQSVKFKAYAADAKTRKLKRLTNRDDGFNYLTKSQSRICTIKGKPLIFMQLS